MTEIIGILNLTPDSFSGDGVDARPQEAIRRMDSLIADGAGMIDIGAESTRPGAILLSPEEEWQRFAPIMEAVKERTDRIAFSFDTRHVKTVEKVLQNLSNASQIFINDVSGKPDDTMMELVKTYGASLILMHALTIPADPKMTIPENEDVVEVVYQWAGNMLEKYGDVIILDPGIGFGKTAQQSFALIKNIARLKSLGAKILVGHSRKSFLSLFTDKKAAERDPETVLISRYLAKQGVDYLRVHDVKSHAAMLKMEQALT